MIELALLAAVGFGPISCSHTRRGPGGVGWLLLNAHITTVLGVLVGAAFVRKTLRAPRIRDLSKLAIAERSIWAPRASTGSPIFTGS